MARAIALISAATLTGCNVLCETSQLLCSISWASVRTAEVAHSGANPGLCAGATGARPRGRAPGSRSPLVLLDGLLGRRDLRELRLELLAQHRQVLGVDLDRAGRIARTAALDRAGAVLEAHAACAERARDGDGRRLERAPARLRRRPVADRRRHEPASRWREVNRLNRLLGLLDDGRL